jgi:hypothetical protein
VTESNFKQVGAAAIAYKHIVAANSPIDINLAKQLNILLENLGVPTDRILIDPTTGSVGYGMEYCYSIMERIRQAALTQNDDKLQYPIINNIAEEVWKTKEAKLSENDDPRLGNAGIRAINLEAITALSALQAGSDLLILRHPKTMRHIRNYLDKIMVKTDLDSMGVDLSLVTTPEAPPSVSKATEIAAATPKRSVSEMPQSEPPRLVAQEPDGDQEAENVRLLPSEPPSIEQPPETVEQHETLAIHSKKVTQKAKSAPDSEEDLGLSEEDIEALKQMSAALRAFRDLILGLARLLSK